MSIMQDVDIRHTREKKKMTAKRKMEICMYDRYDKGRVERGQRNNVDNRSSHLI